MRVAFVHNGMLDAEGVGSTHSASRLVYELADAGHEVTAYCPDRGGPPPDEAATGPRITVEVLDVDDGHSRVPRRRFAPVGERLLDRAAEFERFDVLHSYVSAIPWLAEVGERVSTPVVTSLNGYGPVCPKKDLFYMDAEPCRENGTLRCTRCVLASSVYPERSPVYDGASIFDEYDGAKRIPATAYLLLRRLGSLRTVREVGETADGIDGYHVQADHLTDTFASFGFPEDRFRTVPNMLDERFLVPHESDFEEPYRLLYVGSLTRKKGVQKLLPVLERLESRHDAAYELTVVGDGYLQSTLEREATEKDLDATVAGRLPYEDLPGVYASHDAFVYPGVWEEPFARVFLEALATGTPIVGSSVGDLAEIVDDAGVVTDGSVEGLARGIDDICDPDGLARRSEAARRRAQRYRPAEVVPQFEAFYEDLIPDRAERPT